VRFVLTGSGHIAGVVNPPARKKYQYWTGGAPKGSLEEWMAQAEEHAGSWWDDWQAWLEGIDNKRVKEKRRPGGGKLKPIENAPGSYVMAQA
jgi:polyhydroxyalkanoate synthase